MPVTEYKTKAEFDACLDKNASKLIVVDFTASWCGPCQMMKPKFEAFSNEFTDVVFVKVDVDENDETAMAYDVTCMPTFQFIKNKKVIFKMEGADEATLKAKIVELRK